MRQIKFRGRVPASDKVDGGRIVFGFLVVYDTGTYTHWLYRPNEDRNCPVEPESVQQLIAVDKNGNEIYEGDIVLDKNGSEWEAILYPSLVLPHETNSDDLTVFGEGVTLKED